MINYTTEKETWKDVEGYKGFYQVSDRGSVRSLDRIVSYANGVETLHKGRVLKQENNKGYRRVTLSRDGNTKRVQVHRLVASHFIFHNNHKPHVNHIDGCKSNNIISNLEWCTPAENERHSYDQLGKQALKGEQKNQSKLTEVEVKEIRDLYSRGYLQRELADLYGVGTRHISDVVNKKRWGWLV